MNIKSIVAIAFVVTSASAVAFAGPGHAKKRSARLLQHFTQLDLDQDQRVTLSEMESAAEKRHASADSNNDGEVTQEEMRAARKQQHQERRTERFKSLDSNQDNSLTSDELTRMPAARFAKLDTNQDREISLAEFLAVKGKRGKWHRGSGKKAGAQNKRKKRGKRGGKFAKLDQDKSGTISLAEAKALVAKRFSRLDVNSDQAVTLEELKAAKEARKLHRKSKGKKARRGGKNKSE